MSYQQVTPVIMSTTDYPGWCARFVFNAFGGQNGWGFSTAIEAWHGQKNKHPGERPPSGVAVPIWFSWAGDPRGHTAVSLADGRVLSSPVSGSARGQAIFSSIEALMGAFGGGMAYLGWGEQMDGTVVVRAAALEPHQRQVGGSPAVRRSQPSSQSAAKEPQLGAGEIGNFDGWMRGESVNGNNVWFRGISGDWFWSGAFTSQATTGLADLNSVGPTGSQRQVQASAPVLVRSTPSTASSAAGQIEAGTIITPEGWVNGQEVSGTKIWYKVSGGYSWAGAFTKSDTSGLKDLNTTPAPEPEPTPEPSPGDYTPNIKTPAPSDFPSWIRYEETLKPGVTTQRNVGDAAYYGQKYNPVESHVHWWGAPGQSGTHDSNVAYLNRADGVDVNYVVSEGRITLTIPLNIDAYTTGRRNPYGWKSENDPALTDLGYKTLGYLHYIVEKLNPNLLNEPIRLHKEFSATSCSEIDPVRVREIAEAFRTGALDPATGNPPTPAPGPDPTPDPTPDTGDLEEAIRSLDQNIEKLNLNLTRIFNI